MSKSIVTSTARLSLVGKNIVRMRFKPGVQVSHDQAVRNHKAAQKLMKGKKHLVLFDMRAFVWGSDKAWSFSASGIPRSYRIAVAALINSQALRLNYNRYMKFNKPKVPTLAFTNEKKAIAWLKSFLPE